MILYGARGHAKVVLDSIDKRNSVLYLIDDDVDIVNFEGFIVKNIYDSSQYPDEEFIVSIGDNKDRFKVAKQIKHRFGTVLHPTAYISKKVEIQEGTVVFANAVIQPASVIGKHCIINTKASVDHDCSIGDFVHIAPGAILCGGVTIGTGSFIGAGAVVLPGLSIGNWVTVGAGGIVTKNIPDSEVWFGNPARKQNY